MADLMETIANVDVNNDWIGGIYQLEQEDLVLGGADGIDNLQAKQLQARINYLKSELIGLGVSAFIRTLLDDIDAATARATLGAVTQADIETAIANLVASSPAALDTLNELAAALGNDPNFAATITNALALKAPLASPDLTGVPTAPTAAPGTNNTQLANTEFVQSSIAAANKAVFVDGATFEASVADGEAVRWDAANNRFDEAVADGTTNNRAVGVADVTNSKVYLYGECPLFAGLTPGARYYLDAATPGAITDVVPADAVSVGIAKSATTLFVDIDSGVLPEASETVKGIIELATAAEAQALTDALRAITPSTLNNALKGSNQSLAQNGYQKLPGGLIIQWGNQSVTNISSGTITFPVAFPTACRLVTMTRGGVTNSAVSFSVNPIASSFDWTSSSTPANYFWIALGY